jgi:hypothetical protein
VSGENSEEEDFLENDIDEGLEFFEEVKEEEKKGSVEAPDSVNSLNDLPSQNFSVPKSFLDIGNLMPLVNSKNQNNLNYSMPMLPNLKNNQGI